MQRPLSHHGQSWSFSDVHRLRALAEDGVPLHAIGLKLGRNDDAVVRKANEIGITVSHRAQ